MLQFIIVILSSYVFSIELKAQTLPMPLKSITVKELSGTRGIAESVKIWTLGNRDNISYIWLVFHGDTPKFYTKELSKDRVKLHKRLLSQNKGALLIQPKSLPAKSFKVMGGQGWGDLYGKSKAAIKVTKRKKYFGSMVIKVFRQFEKILKNRSLKLQTVSFSGAGRIDRAFHEYLSWGMSQDNNDNLRVKEFINNNLLSLAACDSMVNRSFYDAKKWPLVQSWLGFLNQFPNIKTTLIYDKNRDYPYMADMIENILKGHIGNQFKLPLRTSIYNKRLKIDFGHGHMNTFIGKLEETLFW